MRTGLIKSCRVVGIVWLLIVCFAAQAAEIAVEAGGTTALVEFEPVAVELNAAGEALFPAGDLLGTSGEPQIPLKALRVLLPPDAVLDSVSCRVLAAEYEPVAGVWAVAPVPPILSRDADGNEIEVWPADKTIVEGRDVAIYSANRLWPEKQVDLAGTGSLRSWKLAELAVPLVRYNPVSGELQRLVSMELAVDCDTPKVRSLRAGGSQRGLDRAKNLTVNFDEAATLYNAQAKMMTRSPEPTSDGYLIVTSQDIRDTSSKLADFVAHKTSMGFAVTVIDEDDLWGTETPVAGDASATKLREWLQANYVALDLKYALIIGDPRTDSGYVPMKMYPCDGRNIPTDYFYAELTADWDANGNGIIGEGGEIERYFEVYVGRIPHYGVLADTDAILQKTIDYETSTDTDWRYKTLISNVPLDSGMHGYNWGEQVKSDLLEPAVVPSDRVYRNGYGQSVEAHTEIVPRPEFPSTAYPATVWSQGQYGLHVWSTHGWAGGASGIISSPDAAHLDDAHPTTVFQGSCENAYPESTGNLSYAILKNGGIVTLGATRLSYYMSEWNFSNTPTDCGMSYRYAKGIVEGKSCGAALWDLKEEISSWWKHNWTLFNPYGDPSVVVMGEPLPAFQIGPTDTLYVQREVGTTHALQSRAYSLFNNRAEPLEWTATHTADWFDVAPTNGTIPAGGSVQVDVTLNAGVAALRTLGSHSGTISFANATHGTTLLRGVECVIGRNDALRLYLPLDETVGNTVDDHSVFEHKGTLFGTNLSAITVSGRFAQATQLDGVDDYVKVEGMNLRANTVTLTAWVKQGTTQNPWAGIVFDRSSSASGLNFGGAGELRYHWNDGEWDWNPGFTPPADSWTFVALVVEPTKATMYMNSGSGFQSAVNIAPHAAAYFNSTFIGRDPTQTRYLNGAVDEVRIYNKALSQTQLQALYEGGGAEGPEPFDTAIHIGALDALAWTPAAAAVNYHVYLGTNAVAVESADLSSNEYRGAVATPLFANPATTVSATNYWRVDVETATGTIAGPVWRFVRNNLEKIELANPSFEDQPTGGGAPSGWSLTTGDPSQLGVSSGGSHGTNYLWIGPGVEITQDLAYTLSAGENLTLNYDSSRSHERTIQLLAKNGETYELLAETTEAIGWSSWGGVELGHTVAEHYAGWQLTLRVISGNWNEFDHFRLTTMGGVATTNAPAWNSSPIDLGEHAVGTAFSGSLATEAADFEGDTLAFSKVSGPSWLNVAPDGELAGTPSGADAGLYSWTVSVTDGSSTPVENTLTLSVVTAIEVDNYSFELPADGKKTNWETVPGWSSDSVASDSGVENAGATDGSWTGFLMASDPAVWNLTGEFIAPGEVYTLRVDARSTGGGGDTLRIRLYYDDAASRVSLATFDVPLAAEMQEFMVQFSSDDVPAAGGQYIGIEFDNIAGGWLGLDNVRLSRTGAPDSDGDRIPDWWETERGLDPFTDDAALHSDSDPFDNAYEYATDTDPKDGASWQAFSVEIAPETGEPTLRFPTSPRRHYTVVCCDELIGGIWRELAPAFPGSGAEMTLPDQEPSTNCFYRLRVSIP